MTNLISELLIPIVVVALVIYNIWQAYKRIKGEITQKGAQLGAGELMNHLMDLAHKGKPFDISDGKQTITLLKVKKKKENKEKK